MKRIRPHGARSRRRRRTLIVAACLGCLPMALAAAPEQPLTPSTAGSGMLLMRMAGGYSAATRLDTSIDVAVSGITVNATVRQSFRNDARDSVEGVYVFPLPDTAAVMRMRLTIGDRVIESVVREREDAESVYAGARADGKRAGLVRQERANVFTTALANIGPGETVGVELAYIDTVTFDDGLFSLRIPLTLTPRYVPGRPQATQDGGGWSPNTDRVPDAARITPPVVPAASLQRVSLHASINAGMPLDVVASRYHDVEAVATDAGWDVRLAGTTVPPDRDIELFWRPAIRAVPKALLFTEVRGERTHLQLMLVPPEPRAVHREAPPRELELVIDTSGSMHGESLEQARAALAAALADLRSQDRFNVIRFASDTEALFPRPVPANSANVDRARRYVRGLTADGGTEMRPALLRALGRETEDRLRQIVFLTDGSVGNEDELFGLIEASLGNARLFTVGIGSAPNRWFMRKAAEAGRGSFVVIGSPREVGEKMTRLFRKLRRPMLTDIELSWPESMHPVAYPAAVPDLYAGEPVVLEARLARAPRDGETLAVRGRLDGAPWAATIPFAKAEPGPGTATVWARAHIAALLDRERRGDEGIRPAVIRTALDHGLVSKYTSMVAVDKSPARPAGLPLVRDSVPAVLPHGQSMQAIFGFPATATFAPAHRRNAALLLGFAALGLLWHVWTLRFRGRDEHENE